MPNPYIPAKDSEFDTWLVNFSTLLTAAPATYGLVAGDATAVDAVTDAWVAAYATAINPSTRTSVTIAIKDTARRNAEVTVRPYAVRISRNPAVTTGNKTAIGVTVVTTTPTPVPPPTDVPILSLVRQRFGDATLGFKTTGFDGKSKPYGSTMLEIVQAIGVAFAVDPSQCSFLTLVTKSPFTVTWSGADAGKKATLFARFRTRSGPAGQSQAGPWSAALNLIITG